MNNLIVHLKIRSVVNMSTIFIVGSSSGIGKATAKLFAEKG
ncbi:hypothetical protein HMPREF3209_01993 [Lactobacillus crispatus]|nr:hypothetical protein HMPREF3209_01993 [Lactobacillus crispatus]